MNWFTAQRLMATARNPEKGKPIGSNTRLYFESAWHEKHYTIRLHGNVIMTIYKHHIVLSDGGWRTVTTKERLNRYLPRGFHVYQKDWVWYLRDSNNDIDYNFSDVQWIHNDGRVWQPKEMIE